MKEENETEGEEKKKTLTSSNINITRINQNIDIRTKRKQSLIERNHRASSGDIVSRETTDLPASLDRGMGVEGGLDIRAAEVIFNGFVAVGELLGGWLS